MLSNQDASLILNGLLRVGPVLLRRLLEAFSGNSVRVLSATIESLMKVRGVGSCTAEVLLHWEKYFDPEREKEKNLFIENRAFRFLHMSATTTDVLRGD